MIIFLNGSINAWKDGIAFIENLSGFEGYAIDAHGIATMTSGFGAYTVLT